MTTAQLAPMSAIPPPLLLARPVLPDQVQFACPACDLVHLLLRGHDLREIAGAWRSIEPGGFECDCGQRIALDFTIAPAPAVPID